MINGRRNTKLSVCGVLLLSAVIVLALGAIPSGRTEEIDDSAGLITDYDIYLINETVTINGWNFTADTVVNVSIVWACQCGDHDSHNETWSVLSDEDGNFSTAYELGEITGIFNATATDGILTAEKGFIVLRSLVWTDKFSYAPGETVLISGAGYTPEVEVNITVILPDNSTESWIVMSNVAGNITATYLTPGIMGSYILIASEGENVAIAMFVDPTVVLTPKGGDAGSQVTVEGYGFYGNGYIYFDGVQVGSFSAYGSFTKTIQIPDDKPVGTYAVQVQGTQYIGQYCRDYVWQCTSGYWDEDCEWVCSLRILGLCVWWEEECDYDYVCTGGYYRCVYWVNDYNYYYGSAMFTVNDAPDTNDDFYQTDMNVLLDVVAPGVLANDSDTAGQILEVQLVNPTSYGSLNLAADGSLEYQPELDYSGWDDFVYRVWDGYAYSDLTRVRIAVGPLNWPPEPVDDTYVTDEDTVLEISEPGILTNDINLEGDPMIAILDTGPDQGTLEFFSDGGFIYTPPQDWYGTTSFTYHAYDVSSSWTLGRVVIIVEPVDDGPVAVDDYVTTDEDTPIIIDVCANDIDVDDPEVYLIGFGYDSSAIGDCLSFVFIDGTLMIRYIPEQNWYGTLSFTSIISDKKSPHKQDHGNVFIIVLSVPDVPVALNDQYVMNEDTVLVADAINGVLANDSDGDGDILTAQLVSDPLHGTLVFNPDGSFIYTPDPDYWGEDSFTYKAQDPSLLESPTTTVTITVEPVDDAPVAVDDYVETDEDTSIIIDVTANDYDVDDPDVYFNSMSFHPLTLHGSVHFVQVDGKMMARYTPTPNWYGTAYFNYYIHDNKDPLKTDQGMVFITVLSVPDEPVTLNDQYVIDEDMLLEVDAANGVLANDSDGDGDILTAQLVSDPLHGTLVFNPDGSFIYTPDPDYWGEDSFTYKAQDPSLLESPTTTVTITVEPVDDAPVAVDDYVETDEDTSIIIDVTANDYDVDDPDVYFNSMSFHPLTLHGSVHFVQVDGRFKVKYTPAPNWHGTAYFNYVIHNQKSDEGRVYITVLSVPDEPVALNDQYVIDEDMLLEVDAANGVLANDSDGDGDIITAQLISDPLHGTLVFNPDGSFIYTPDPDYWGEDSFTYKAQDPSLLESPTTTVTITVEPVDDAPVAVDDYVETDEDTSIIIDVTANDYDVDDPDVYFNEMSYHPDTLHGSVHFVYVDGRFKVKYTPAPNWHGTAYFNYVIHNQKSDEGRVYITVLSVPDEPVALNDQYVMEAGTTLSVDPSGILTNDSDVDGDILTSILDTSPSLGTLTLSDDGSFTYTPDYGFVGEDFFTYYANDGLLDSNIATVTITVIDTTPPVTNIELTGEMGDNNWYTSPVTITLIPTDVHTLVETTYFSLDGINWEIYNGPFTVSTEGSLEIKYYSIDIAGNIESEKFHSFKIDTMNPVTTIKTSFSPGLGQGWWIWSPNLPLGFSFEVEGVESPQSGLQVTSYSFDGVTWYDYTGGWVLFSGEGIYTVYYRSTDMAGNIETTKSKIIRLDGTFPEAEVFITGTEGTNGWYLSDVEISIVASDVPSGLFRNSYRINGGDWIENEGPFIITTEGITNIEWSIMDMAGWIQSDSFTVKIDKTTPQTTIVINPPIYDIWYNTETVTCQLVTFEEISSFVGRYRIDGGDFLTFTDGATITISGECYHLLEYYAIDLAGNVETIHTHEIGIDLAPPNVDPLLEGVLGNEQWWQTPVHVTLNVLDQFSGFANFLYWVNGVPFNGLIDGFEVDFNTEGIHDINWETWDNVLWYSSGDITVKVDLVDPVTELTYIQVARVGSIVTLTATDSISGVHNIVYSLDGETWIPYDEPFTLSVGGVVPVYFKAIDVAGREETTKMESVDVDVSPPETTVVLDGVPGCGDWYVSDVEVSMTATDDLMGVDEIFYSYDGSSWSTYSIPLYITDEGLTEIHYYAIDNVGNEETIRIQEIYIDKTTPETSLFIDTPVFGSDPSYVSSNTPFQLSATDTISGVNYIEYIIDDDGWTTYHDVFTVTEFGFHVISFRSIDIAGNVEALQSVEIMVNTTLLTYTGVFSGVYSDPVILNALLLDIATQKPISSKTVEFSIGSQKATATTGFDGVASVVIVLNQPSGIYPVSAIFIGDNEYLGDEDDATLTIEKETALISYTGSTVVPTTVDTITFRATVSDNIDGYWGDLTKIFVTFTVHNVPIEPNAPVLVVGPYQVECTNVDGIGVAVVEIPNLAENSYLVSISLEPEHNNYYQGDNSHLVTITIYEPTGDFVTGGGWIQDTDGNKGNFGFNVKYKKNGLPKGQAVFVFHVGDLEYIVKSNAWLGMAIEDNHAFFEAKCVVQIYNAKTGELLWDEGNYLLRIDVWDNEESEDDDIYQIRVFDKNGIVYYEAGYDPIGYLHGGNIVIHLDKEDDLDG